MPEISFLSKGITFKLTRTRKTSEWLTAIARKEERKIESLSYVFSTDPFVAALNKKYLQHDSYTDIITFDYSEGGPVIGEIYISIPRVRENAKIFGQSFAHELRRVMAHGLLHIIGYTDKTVRRAAQMRSKEEACLSLWR